MKAIKLIASAIVLVLALALSGQEARAQFMPVVFDNTYGKTYQFSMATADFQNGDVVIAGADGDNMLLTWLDRQGETRFSKRFTPSEFNNISRVEAIDDEHVLVMGSRSLPERETSGSTGRAMVIDKSGAIQRSVVVGGNGAVVAAGRVLPNGTLILAGSTPEAGGRSGMVCKVNAANKVVYTYIASTGELCEWFDVHGSKTEYVNAAFTSVDKEGGSVIRLDDNGKPFFITPLPDPTFKIEKMVNGHENDLFLVGQGQTSGGAVIKIRQEGDIVFERKIVPASPQTRLNHLIICPTGEVLVGGNDVNSAYFTLLRNDGTVVATNMGDGVVSAMTINPANGDCLVSTYSPAEGNGRIVKTSRQGNRLYDKVTAANYNTMFINANGDLLLGSAQTGRLSMLSALGELLFDRYVVENTPTTFADVYLPSTGEALFLGADSRVAKLAHGVYVSDILVNKPINGHVSATFTVTVSGYSFSKEGSPLPVSVAYNTRPISATEGVNFDAVAGTISFVPSADGSDRYLNKFTVEVPVNANDLLEGSRTFALDLSDVKHSYLIKSSSTATIADQPAIVKLIAVTPGVEGEKDLVYQLGIFKRDNTKLTNRTAADIVVDGIYGTGSADDLDVDTGRKPRLVIASGQHSGTFNVETFDDTRYEAAKTVVLDFNQIHAMSDTEVSFGSSQLSCQGTLYDQAARVVIESLGDRIKRSNDVVNGLFKIALVRASDGALLTNNSGADIALQTSISDAGTARHGEDFVITNAHSLRIAGDGRSSTVNLNGLVLHTPDPEAKNVVVTLREVQAGADAGPLTISADKDTAQFKILNN